MSRAMVTSRTLKNTETGIDITVPEYRTISKLLTTEEEFHVIVISNLSYFKSASHKKDDVVQFMIPKWYHEFETLHKAMSERYPATIFPDLPKKLLMLKDSTPQSRRAAFDKLMQFIAASTKVCTSPILLEFLGVNQAKIDAVEGRSEKETTDGAQKTDIAETMSPTKSIKSQGSSLFGDEDSDDELFKTEKEELEEPDSDLFSPSPSHAPAYTNGASEEPILNTQDTSSASNEELRKTLFFSPDGTPTVTSSDILDLVGEDNSDLLNVEDDLDKLLVTSAKPKLSPKPAILPKPAGNTSVSKPPIKPRTSPETAAVARPSTNNKDSTQGALDQEADDANLMAEDDILKYIQQNTESGDSKLDLF